MHQNPIPEEWGGMGMSWSTPFELMEEEQGTQGTPQKRFFDLDDDKTSTSSSPEHDDHSPSANGNSGESVLNGFDGVFGMKPLPRPAEDLRDERYRGLGFGVGPQHDFGASNMKPSPSFQELERAIGASLAITINNADAAPPHFAESVGKGYPTGVDFASMEGFVEAKPAGGVRRPSTFVDLENFINESESRALVLFHPPMSDPGKIKRFCEQYGMLYYFREEFQHRGVTFLGYFDLRASTEAHGNLLMELSVDDQWSVHYSVMLNATSSCDESRLCVKNMPSTSSESDVQNIFARYGELRSIQRTFGSGREVCEFVVEYFNIQDARLACSELSATADTLWGPEVVVTPSQLEMRKQQLARKLLGIIGQWRGENRYSRQPVASGSRILSAVDSHSHVNARSPVMHPHGMLSPHSLSPTHYGPNPNAGMHMSPPHPAMTYRYMQPHPQSHTYTAYQLSPRSNHAHLPAHQSFESPSMDAYGGPSPRAWNGIQVPRIATGISIQPRSFNPNSVMARDLHEHDSMSIHSDSDRNTPREANNRNKQHANGTARRGRSTSGEGDFMLDLDRVLDLIDRRTTIMIRNIPNKYTQQMLLEEINVHHMGTYDFFYLPIDFKNKCNVGYAFINFMDPLSIVPFFQEFNGQRWRNFNSEKVCAISYARIQGKGAMIARFQNSSLLEKDCEYRPLLFVSSGPDKGLSEPFPLGSRLKPSRTSSGTRPVEERERSGSRDSSSSGEKDHPHSEVSGHEQAQDRDQVWGGLEHDDQSVSGNGYPPVGEEGF